jgi:subtilisin family serine protease
MHRIAVLISALLLALLLLPGCPDSEEEKGPAGGPDPAPAPAPPAGDPPWLGEASRVPMEISAFVPPTIRRPTADRIVELSPGGPRVVRDEYVLMLREGVREEQVIQALGRQGLGAEVVGRIPSAGVIQVEVPSDRPGPALARMRQIGLVEAVDRNVVLTPPPPVAAPPPAGGTVARPPELPDDPVFHDEDPGNDWGLRAVRAPQAWQVTRGRPEVVIAIVDSGVDVEHEELAGKIVSPWSVASRDGRQDLATIRSPSGGHGTHVAITAAGIAGNGKGTAGVAPRCSVMPIQVMLLQDGETIGTLMDMVAGIEKARTSGADVINLSMGINRSEAVTRRFHDPATRAETAEMLAGQRDGWLTVLDAELERCRAQGILFVGSAGNDDLPTRYTAKAYTGKSICVGAASWVGDGDYDRWASSNYDEHVTLAAPGHRVWSGVPGNGYGLKSGTSMASPHVAGTAALLKSIDGNLGLEEAREILMTTAGVEVESDPAKPVGRMVDAEAAVRELLRRRAVEKPSDPVPVEHRVHVYRATTGGVSPGGKPFVYYRFHPGNVIAFRIDHGVYHRGEGLRVRTTHAAYPHGSEEPVPGLTRETVFPHPSAGKFVAYWTARVPEKIRPGRYVYVGTVELLDPSGTLLAVDQRAIAFEVYPPLPASRMEFYDPIRIPIAAVIPPVAIRVAGRIDRKRYLGLLGKLMEFMRQQQAVWRSFQEDMGKLDGRIGKILQAAGGFGKLTAAQRADFRRSMDAVERRRSRLLREFRAELRSRFRQLLGQPGETDTHRAVRTYVTKLLAVLDLASEVGRLQRGIPEITSDEEARQLGMRVLSVQRELVPLAQEAEGAEARIRKALER